MWSELSKIVKQIKKQAKLNGFSVIVTSGSRSREKQAALYEARSGSAYPVAPPGTSQHEYGFAVDMVARPAQMHSTLVQIAQGYGLVWSPNDAVHFAVFTRDQWNQVLSRLATVKGSRKSRSVTQILGSPSYAVVKRSGLESEQVPISIPLEPLPSVAVGRAASGSPEPLMALSPVSGALVPPNVNEAIQVETPGPYPGLVYTRPISRVTNEPLGPAVLAPQASTANAAESEVAGLLSWYRPRWLASGLSEAQQIESLNLLRASRGLPPV